MSTFSEIIKSSTPVLVDFHATWCGPCKQMQPILDTLKEKKKADLRILKIDVDKNRSLAEKYQIRSVPTLILFHNGKQIWKKSGVMTVQELTEKTKVK